MRPSPLEDQQEFQLPQVSRGDFLAFFQPIGTISQTKSLPFFDSLSSCILLFQGEACI
jgi:hypothetical protein